MKKQIAIPVGMLLVLAVFGFVGHMDYEDEQAAQAQYCEMVKVGHWPDYQGTYRRECLPPKSVPR